MEKKHVLIFYIAAVALIIFGIILFLIANGTISMARLQNEDGSFEYTCMLYIVIPFTAIILSFAGLLTILQEDIEFSAWLTSAGVIVVVSFLGYLFNSVVLAVFIQAGLYAIVWFISAVRTLISAFTEGEFEDAILALSRFVLAAVMVISFIVIVNIPMNIGELNVLTEDSVFYCYFGGAVSLVGAVACITEGTMWWRVLDY